MKSVLPLAPLAAGGAAGMQWCDYRENRRDGNKAAPLPSGIITARAKG